MWFLNITRGFIFLFPVWKVLALLTLETMSRVIFSSVWFWCLSSRLWEWPIAVLNLFLFYIFVIAVCVQMPCWGMLCLFSNSLGGLWQRFLPSKAGCLSPCVPCNCLWSIPVLLRYGNGAFCDPARLDWPSSPAKLSKVHATLCVALCMFLPPTDVISLRIRLCLCYYGSGARLMTWHVILTKRWLNEWKNRLICCFHNEHEKRMIKVKMISSDMHKWPKGLHFICFLFLRNLENVNARVAWMVWKTFKALLWKLRFHRVEALMIK